MNAMEIREAIEWNGENSFLALFFFRGENNLLRQ